MNQTISILRTLFFIISCLVSILIVFPSVLLPELDQPPVAHVVSSPPISLPVKTAILDGSHSTDDKGGVSYLWTRDNTSPAAGVRMTLILVMTRPLTGC